MNPSRDHDRSARERAEGVERATLSTWAVPASESKGRERPEPSDPVRSAFQVDRDRVLRSAAFARLADKTVGVPTRHHPNRMQQVAHCASLAGWVARSLGLNGDLTEAIAYGSVLGAPPFGEAGAAALSSVVGAPFVVGEQSLRVVERLERGGVGLNLTWEVRDGIVHASWEQTPAATYEGQAVRLLRRAVEVVDAWTSAGHPELPPATQRELGHEPDAMIATLLGDLLAVPVDGPDVLSGELIDRHLPAILDAVERSHGSDGARAGESERAVHVVSSLVIFEMERTAAADLRAAVDRVSSWADGEALAAFRDRFQPTG